MKRNGQAKRVRVAVGDEPLVSSSGASLMLAVDVHGCGVEVDVAPLQAEQFAAAQPEAESRT